MIRIGCSGWSYDHWRGRLYPAGTPTGRWLELYAATFDTVELNATFYRLPVKKTVERWAEATPAGFCFAVKASRYLTHVRRLQELREGLERLAERLEPLVAAGKLGPVLWQLPPTFERDDERLAAALAALPPGGRHAFEFRHPSWFAADVYALLRANGAALVVADRASLYPTPNRDDGYDVTDHCAVDPRLGTLAELEEVLRECDRSGIRVVLDLVANHTSDEHPWFVEARSDRSSPRRAYYVWSDTPCSEPAGVVFPGEVDRSWTYDPIAGQYYLHRYHPFQPDLDVGNPDVRAELERIIAFWLDRGVAGFRVDSAPFVIEQIGWGSRLADPHDVFRRWRSLATAHRSDAVLLGEAYLPPGQQADYFGDDDEFHALYDFHRNNGTWLALARASAEPLRRAFVELPDPPGTSRWFPFLRLHDELSFEKLPASERDAVLDAFSPTEETRIYGRGTRRRVAPMLGDDPARLRLAYSLLLSFPGSPVLLYGDELGLHDDLSLPGRTSVRVPMRWRPGRNGGFSEASREGLVRRVRTDAVADRANVEAQEEDPESLLRWLRRAVAARGRIPELTCGRGEVVETGDDAVFAHRCDLPGSSFVAVHNLSGVPRAISLSLDAAAVVDVLGDGPPPEGAGGALGLTLPRYGYRWLRVERAPASGAAATGSRPSRERASR